jgi:predicted dehydrogenase
MPYKMIQVGTGGHGRSWCERFLPPNVQDGLIEVVAAVDVNPEALLNAQKGLGLRADQCYTDMRQAFAENKADFCTIVVPPNFHEAVVDLALAHDLHILSEKPIADTLVGAARIAEKVRRAGKKMGVTMSHRFDQDKTTLRQELRSGAHGPLDYLMMRFTCDMRKFGGWGAAFRHTMRDPLMIEGAVHHLDILADLAAAKCDTLYAQTWNPRWGSYGGDSQGLVTMHFENGTRAVYEGAKTNAVGINGWAQEYVRAECEGATLVLDRRHLVKLAYNPETMRADKRESEGETIALIEQPKWANAWLVEQFVHWLAGGAAMPTNVEDNLQSVALIFAAIQSSRSGQPVQVQEFLAQARQQAVSELG